MKEVEGENINHNQSQPVINKRYSDENNDKKKMDMALTPVMNSISQGKKITISDIDSTELDEKIQEMISVDDGRFSCTLCAYTSTKKFNLRKHVETHIEGLSFSCQDCDKSFRLRYSLYRHVSQNHITKF